MRRPIASLVVAIGCLTGCPPTEDPDVEGWYRRGSEDVLVCQNGAFSATLSSSIVEGLWSYGETQIGPASVVATVGETGAAAFTLAYREDGSWGSAELGEAWIRYGVNDSEREVVHARCAALEAQPWWH